MTQCSGGKKEDAERDGDVKAGKGYELSPGNRAGDKGLKYTFS